MTVTDPVLARRRLEAAIAANTKPVLDAAHVDDLMAMAESTDPDGGVIYTAEGLNQAAAIGWQDKAGLVSAQYDLDADGSDLKRSQMFKHCMEMAGAFAEGRLGVIRTPPKRSPRGMGVIRLAPPSARDPEIPNA